MARIFSSFSQFFGNENYDSGRYAREYEKRRLLMTHLLKEGASIPAVMNFCWNEGDNDLPAADKFENWTLNENKDVEFNKMLDRFLHPDPESSSPDDDYWCSFGHCINRLIKIGTSSYGLYNAILDMERMYEME